MTPAAGGRLAHRASPRVLATGPAHRPCGPKRLAATGRNSRQSGRDRLLASLDIGPQQQGACRMATVTFENVSKRYGDVVAVDDINLDIRDAEFMVDRKSTRLNSSH